MKKYLGEFKSDNTWFYRTFCGLVYTIVVLTIITQNIPLKSCKFDQINSLQRAAFTQNLTMMYDEI